MLRHSLRYPGLTLPPMDASVIGHGLCLTLPPAVAAAPDAADRLCHAVEQAAGFRAGDPEAMRLAVHEALANAVLHGCLGLASAPRSSREGCEAYAAALAARLADPLYADALIDIGSHWTTHGILVSIADPGPGYDPAATVGGGPAGTSGRGLALIRAFANDVIIDEGGRHISLWFDR